MDMVAHRDGSSLQVSLAGKLTFSDNSAFQSVTEIQQENGTVKQIDLHLEHLEYIDSSGIGMLLVLKERCDAIGATMTLSSPRGQVAKILRIACIDRVIPILP